MEFSLVHKDALEEYMNVFIGRAASLLSEMVSKKVKLSITEMHLLSFDEDFNNAYDTLPAILKGHIVSSSIRFGDDFSGKAHLVFPLEKSKKLVNYCIFEDDPDEEMGLPGELTDTDYDAVKEIGNVILNSVTGGLGNLLQTKLQYQLPAVETMVYFDPEKELGANEVYMLVFYNSFAIADMPEASISGAEDIDSYYIEGAIVVVLSLESITMLLEKIEEVLMELDE